MPTYDYVCRFCDHSFEHFQGISDPLRRKCPKCERMGLDRLIGAGIGIVFKGSGFYETDYKRASEKKSDKSADQGDKSDQSAKSDTTSGTNSADKDSSAKQPAAKKATKPKDS